MKCNANRMCKHCKCLPILLIFSYGMLSNGSVLRLLIPSMPVSTSPSSSKIFDFTPRLGNENEYNPVIFEAESDL